MADFTGTAADDVFTGPATSATTGAAATTVNSGDAIDGGAGNDTLNITATATNNNSLTGLTATSIETVNIAGANNLGASSPALAAAQDAKAVTAAALTAKNASLVVAAQQANAAAAVNAVDTNIEATVVGLSSATSTALAASRAAAAVAVSDLAAAADDALADVEAVADLDTGDFEVLGFTAFTLAQYQAAAAAALKAADSSAVDPADIADRAEDLAVAAIAVDLAAKSTTVDLATAVQKSAAAAAVVGLDADEVIALTELEEAPEDFDSATYTFDQYQAAANAALIASNGTEVAEADIEDRADALADAAADLVEFEQDNGDFTLAQLNSAAKAALSSNTGATLVTNLDDGSAVAVRAAAKAEAAVDVLDAATTAAATAAAADASAANAVTVALDSVVATSVSAAQFADATAITLSGASSKANVTGVAATQTIGFKSVSSMANEVTFGATVAAGSLAVSASTGTLTVTGATMAALNISGTGSTALTLVDKGDLVSATGADTIKALNLSTSGATAINTTGMTALTSVTQTGAGAVTLNDTIATGTNANKLASITTGAGADNVRVTTVTAADNPGTTIDETVNASVSTGAGNDKVIVATSSSGTGKTTVDAGEGNDTIILSTIGTGANSLSGGAGNDTFRIGALSTIATTTISGGDGTDVLRTAETGTFTATHYTTLVANVSSIETLQLASGTTTVSLDASKVAVNRIEFLGSNVANTVTEVSSSQALAAVRTPDSAKSFGLGAASAVVVKNITASAKDYDADGNADNGGKTIFGDNLNIAMTHVAADARVVAKGNALTLSVTALGAVSADSETAGANVTGIDSQVTLSGDVKSVAATLTSARGVGSVDAQAALGAENVAKLVIKLDADGEDDEGTRTLANLETVTVSGAGVVTIDTRTDLASTAATLKTIDLSGMTAFADLNALGQEIGVIGDNQNAAGAYRNKSTSTVTLDNNVVETLVLGGAKDTVVTASTYAKADTITGFQLVADAANPLVADASRSDVLSIAGGATALTATTAAKMTVTGSTLEAALLQAASLKAADGITNVENVVFNFGGDTYFFKDLITGDSAQGLDDGDILVKMSGTLNLDLLLTSGVIIV